MPRVEELSSRMGQLQARDAELRGLLQNVVIGLAAQEDLNAMSEILQNAYSQRDMAILLELLGAWRL